MHFFDEKFWIAIAFVIFVFLAYRPVRRSILKALDLRIEEIKNKLQQTQKLQDDAKISLVSLEQEMEHFTKHTEEMLEHASTSTEHMIEKRSKELQSSIRHSRDAAVNEIENKKNKVAIELRDEFTESVSNLVKSYLEQLKDREELDTRIINQVLNKEVPKKEKV